MSSAVNTPNKPRRTADPNATLDQILDRHRELILQREYQPLGIIDYIWVVRGSTTVQMDFRKTGPKLAFNPETGDFLLMGSWQGLPDLPQPDPQRCKSCVGECGDCQGKGTKPCTLAGCAGSGYVNSRYEVCPDCLGSPKKKTNPKCARCSGRGEVPDPVKCGGCDEKGLARCARCDGSGKISTGREKGKKDGYDADSEQWKTAPLCQDCKGQGRIIQTKPQDWRQFVHGRISTQSNGTMIAVGPIARILWHTMGDGARFQSCEISPDGGGNLMVLLLENDQPGARQFLVGGVPQIK
jgi:hypothetical protein